MSEALNEVGKPVKGSRVLLLGLAYKANVDDDRESPSYVLLEKLSAKGAIVSYFAKENFRCAGIAKTGMTLPGHTQRNGVCLPCLLD
jgi:UDP-N-acetyl-D-mannosaminuronate dehydrogenase